MSHQVDFEFSIPFDFARCFVVFFSDDVSIPMSHPEALFSRKTRFSNVWPAMVAMGDKGATKCGPGSSYKWSFLGTYYMAWTNGQVGWNNPFLCGDISPYL